MTETLSLQCVAAKEDPLRVVLDTDIRWNSTLNMLQRAFVLRKHLTYISNTLVTNKLSIYEILDENDWEVCKTVIDLLEPLKQGFNLLIFYYYYLMKSF